MEKIKARFIIEMMGRPPEHLEYALSTLLDKINSEKGISIKDKKTHKPKPVKDAKNVYTTFAEVDAEFETPEHFFGLVLGYMPSNIEVYYPETFKLQVSDLNSLANFITVRLHRYEEITKRVMFERDILAKQLQSIKSGENIASVNAADKPKDNKKIKNKKVKK